ncbi:hypothetical protein COCVIDRAFT_100036 [Bipolaris victoriae FI3]|uniref:Uncharacterized protein n=1 Tax=Bipolaris victoriae (strain FI3) TaxID=930091 RepID=W7EF29_BIPV3|nr:hypothetical protein COCVIDRAFT_100036 [Bipolaris victoriae FI3]
MYSHHLSQPQLNPLNSILSAVFSPYSIAPESHCNLIYINNALFTVTTNIRTNILKDIKHAFTAFDTMRFNILPMIAIAATLPSVSLSAPTTDSIGIFPRDNTAAIIGTWDDQKCGISKVDDSVAIPDDRPTGNCKELRGNSMQVFWVKKGCVGTYIDPLPKRHKWTI